MLQLPRISAIHESNEFSLFRVTGDDAEGLIDNPVLHGHDPCPRLKATNDQPPLPRRQVGDYMHDRATVQRPDTQARPPGLDQRFLLWHCGRLEATDRGST